MDSARVEKTFIHFYVLNIYCDREKSANRKVCVCEKISDRLNSDVSKKEKTTYRDTYYLLRMKDELNRCKSISFIRYF